MAVLFSCNKINLPTELGQDLIPPVDNVHTFDTTLDVETYNGIFSFADDSARSSYADLQYLGQMNDPIFGRTDARMFFELKPQRYKFSFGNIPSKLSLDSVVLVLGYVNTYGDTLTPQTVEVSELDPATNFRPTYNLDSGYMMRENNFVTATVLGTKTVLPYTLNDSIKIYKDSTNPSVANELRIPLSNSFGQRMINYDTSGTSSDAYSSDSLFRLKFKGFALKSTSGNSIMGFGLGTVTKLAFYYKYENPSTPGEMRDTVAYFLFSTGSSSSTTPLSASANYIGRDYSGTQVEATAGDDVADDIVYIQNTPGAYAKVKIPGLKGLQNSIVHLAELQMEQIAHPQDSLFNTAPLFLDLFDSTANKYKTIPYTIANSYLAPVDQLGTFYTISAVGYQQFGSRHFFKADPAGNRVKEWKFNLTRYVQYLFKGTVPTGDLRLHMSFNMMIENGNPNSGTAKIAVQTTGAPASSRVRLGGGNHPTQKMKLRIIYSKLK